MWEIKYEPWMEISLLLSRIKTLWIVLNANESIENTIEKRKKKKRGTLIKLDIEKADEYTDWDFSDYVMAH